MFADVSPRMKPRIPPTMTFNETRLNRNSVRMMRTATPNPIAIPSILLTWSYSCVVVT